MKYGGEATGFHLAAERHASCATQLSSEGRQSECTRDQDGDPPLLKHAVLRSVAERRLSTNSAEKLDKRRGVKAPKLPEDSEKDIAGDSASGLVDEPSRSDGRFKGDTMERRSKREPRKRGDTADLFNAAASCLHGSEDCCRSEELSDIINFLIETDPKRGEGDYTSSVSFLDAEVTEPRGSPDCGKEDTKIEHSIGSDLEDIEEGSTPSSPSSRSLYAFSYEPAMTHNRDSSQSDQRDEPSSASFQEEWVKGSLQSDEENRCESPALEQSPTEPEDQLEPSHAPSFESLVSSSDSEGRLVIDESPDITPDNGILATPYQYDGALRESDCPGDTTLSAGRGKVSDTEGDLSSRVAVPDDVLATRPQTAVDEADHLRHASDGELASSASAGQGTTTSSQSTPQVPRDPEGTEVNQRGQQSGELVWLPYMSHTTSVSTSQCSDVSAEPGTDNTAKNSTESAERTSARRGHCNSTVKRRELSRSRRHRRSHSADSAPSPQRSNILSVYTTVCDGKIMSVDCKRYRKRPRCSVSKDRACGERSGSSQPEVASTHVRKTDDYDVVSTVIRDMVDTTVRTTEETPFLAAHQVTDPGPKHLLRSFCDNDGCRYEDFVPDSLVPTCSATQTAKGDARGHSTRRGASSSVNSVKAPPAHRTRSRKRRRKPSPSPGKGIVTRSQWKKTCYEQFLREMNSKNVSDALPQIKVKRRRARLPAPETCSAYTESSVDLSGAIASLEIDGEARGPRKDGRRLQVSETSACVNGHAVNNVLSGKEHSKAESRTKCEASHEVPDEDAKSEGTQGDVLVEVESDHQDRPADDSETEELDDDMLDIEGHGSDSPRAGDVEVQSPRAGSNQKSVEDGRQVSQVSSGVLAKGAAVEDPSAEQGDQKVAQGAVEKCSVKEEPVLETGDTQSKIHSQDIVHRTGAELNGSAGTLDEGIEPCPAGELSSAYVLESGLPSSASTVPTDTTAIVTVTTPVTLTDSSGAMTADQNGSAQDDNKDPEDLSTSPQTDEHPAIKQESRAEQPEDDVLYTEAQGEPLNLSTKGNPVQCTRAEVPVGTVLPQMAATAKSTDPSHPCIITTEDHSRLNYSCNTSTSHQESDLTPAHVHEDKGSDKSTKPPPDRQVGSSESILQRLLLESSKSNKADDYEPPMPIIVDVRSMQEGISDGVSDPTRNEQDAPDARAALSATLASRQQPPTQLPGTASSKASASVPPMSFPENTHGMTTLESKILELKKQIHHLTILATYKEKELGCIRNLRLAKEEALKQLECKYPSIFCSPAANRTELSAFAQPEKYSGAGPVSPELALGSDNRSPDIEKLRIAQEKAIALAGLCSSSVQNSSGVDSVRGGSTFHRIAPKQHAPNEDCAGHRQPSGPFWLRDTSSQPFSVPRSPQSSRLPPELVGAKTSPGIPSVQQLSPMPPLWHTRVLNGADSQYLCSDTSRDSSVSPHSNASLTASPVQAQTFSPGVAQLSAGHNNRHPFPFANVPHSISSEPGDFVLGSGPLSKSNRDSGCNVSSNIFAPLPTVYSHEDLLAAEAEQRRALNTYAQLLQGNRDGIPPELAAAFFQDRQNTAVFSSSQAGGLLSAVNSWMEHARTSQGAPGSACSNPPQNRSRYDESRLKVPHSRHAFGGEGKFVQGGLACVNCGDPRVKYVCSCCRTQTFCSEQCQMQLWTKQNRKGKRT